MSKRTYILFESTENLDNNYEYDFDHDNPLIQRHIVEIDDEEFYTMKEFLWNRYVLVPIVEKVDFAILVEEFRVDVKAKLKVAQEKQAKNKATSDKRKITAANNKKRKELKQLKELQEKYDV